MSIVDKDSQNAVDQAKGQMEKVKSVLKSLSPEQLQRLHDLLLEKQNMKKEESGQGEKKYIELNGKKIPTKLNWRDKAEFTPVKDQGRCNACYAFSAVAALETQNSIKNGSLQTFSEQEILDCSLKNNECIGGQAFLVYDYIKEGGINEDSLYPYSGQRNKCQKKLKKRWKGLQGQLRVEQGVINLILALNIGPVSVV